MQLQLMRDVIVGADATFSWDVLSKVFSKTLENG